MFGDLGVNSGRGTVGGHLYSNSSPPGLRRLATCPARVFTAARDGDEWRRLSGTKQEETDKGVTQISWSLSQFSLFYFKDN